MTRSCPLCLESLGAGALRRCTKCVTEVHKACAKELVRGMHCATTGCTGIYRKPKHTAEVDHTDFGDRVALRLVPKKHPKKITRTTEEVDLAERQHARVPLAERICNMLGAFPKSALEAKTLLSLVMVLVAPAVVLIGIHSPQVMLGIMVAGMFAYSFAILD